MLPGLGVGWAEGDRGADGAGGVDERGRAAWGWGRGEGGVRRARGLGVLCLRMPM